MENTKNKETVLQDQAEEVLRAELDKRQAARKAEAASAEEAENMVQGLLMREVAALADRLTLPEEYNDLLMNAAFLKIMCKLLRKEVESSTSDNFEKYMALYNGTFANYLQVLQVLHTADMLNNVAEV